MDKKVIYSDSSYENINIVKKRVSTSLRVATFCIVTEVDTNSKRLNAQPLITEEIYTDKDNTNYRMLPELVNVPYNYNVKEEPVPGDYCICIHLDRSIKGFTEEDLLNGRGKSNNNRHNLSDCVAIVGFKI